MNFVEVLNKFGMLPAKVNRLLILISDLLVFLFSFIVCGVLLQNSLNYFYQFPIIFSSLLVSILSIGAAYYLNVYRNKTKYLTVKIIPSVVLVAFVSTIFLLLNDWFFDYISISKLILYFLLVSSLLIALRFGAREIFRINSNKLKQKVVIYGAGQIGQQILNAYRFTDEYEPVAIIDDDPSLVGKLIGGLPVYSEREVEALKQKLENFFVVFSASSLPITDKLRVYESFRSLDIEVKVIPGISELSGELPKIDIARKVRISDVLGREQRHPNQKLLEKLVMGKAVLVTGAGGSIGSKLSLEIFKRSPEILVLFDISEHALYNIHSQINEKKNRFLSSVEIIPILGNVLDVKIIEKTVQDFNIDTIYHTAAYKHVPMVEGNIKSGIENNIFGTQNVVNASNKFGVKNFILVSTDKAVRPTNVMGASKRIAELIIQASNSTSKGCIFSAVRFGNVLGSSGSVIPKFQEQIEVGGPVTVTHPKITRFFMTIEEAAQLVMQAAAMSKGGEIYLLDMGYSVKILDLAKTMINLAGLNYHIQVRKQNLKNL